MAFLAIILLVAAILLVYRYRERIAAWKGEETLRFIIAAVLIINEGFYYWRVMYVGSGGSSTPKQLITKLPLQVCEWSAYLAAFMLMKKSRHIFDICYYICLTLGVIPFFTPAVIEYTGPTYARYYQFWFEHTLPVFAVFYMMFVHGFKANYRKVYKPFALLAVLATLAIIANLNIEGANFMYLAATTDGDSIANILPQNIWIRLVLYLGILIVLFALVSLPHIIPELSAWRKKKAALAAESADEPQAETAETSEIALAAAEDTEDTEKKNE
ncbi:MAG: TIGR02206 family membrane protein [Clostridia bacterium]|nr:TIGR02206 family membrane protein [Clostridia bacterium]